MVKRWVVTLGVVVSAFGWAHEAPRLCPLPLEVASSPGPMKHWAVLLRVFEETLDSQVGIVAPSMREVAAVPYSDGALNAIIVDSTSAYRWACSAEA